MVDPTGRESDIFMLRLPEGLRDRLKVYAEHHRRSMNAEIVARIEESLDAELEVAVVKLDYLADVDDLSLAADRLEAMAEMARDRIETLLREEDTVKG